MIIIHSNKNKEIFGWSNALTDNYKAIYKTIHTMNVPERNNIQKQYLKRISETEYT